MANPGRESLVAQRLPDVPSDHGCVADEGLVLIKRRQAPTNTSPFFQSPLTNERCSRGPHTQVLDQR
jgi:hypothetical protein